jgi:tetratricopeptide (TPR) repeat protein
MLRLFQDDRQNLIVDSDEDKSCLYALVELAVSMPTSKDAAREIIKASVWRHDEFRERNHLLRRLQVRNPRPDSSSSASEEWWCNDRRLIKRLRRDQNNRDQKNTNELRRSIRNEIIRNPAVALGKISSIYDLISTHRPSRYREIALSELSLLAAGAARICGDFSLTEQWLERAHKWLSRQADAGDGFARLRFQRAAAKLELGLRDEAIEECRELRPLFARSGNREFALRCDYLEAAGLKEKGLYREALPLFESALREARAQNDSEICSYALTSIAQVHAAFGDFERIRQLASEAVEVSVRCGNWIAIAKLTWGVGLLLRTNERLRESIEVFRLAIHAHDTLGARSDAAALHLVVADMLIDLGENASAVDEICTALPALRELELSLEIRAAVALLAQSIRGARIDRGSLVRVAELLRGV